MKLLFPLSSHVLHERTVFLDGEERPGATLLPFFDRHGFVRQVLLLDGASSEPWLFDPSEATLRSRGWRKLELTGEVRRLTRERLRLLSGLWHFDPWSLWTELRYRFGKLAPMLAKTNCFGALRIKRKKIAVSKLHYRSILSGVLWATYQTKTQCQLVFFSSCELSEPTERDGWETAGGAGPRRWQLAPSWQRTRRDSPDSETTAFHSEDL
jgi:hypothetical protein